MSDFCCRCGSLSDREREELLLSGRNPAWKLRSPDRRIEVDDGHYGLFAQNPARDAGDCIVRRSDGIFAYQLAVSVDDMQMGITRVVRGRDLLSSAPRQKWLIETLGGTAPAYAHSPLLTGDKGKLSKRLGSLNTQTLRKEKKPEEVVGQLAFLCGLTDRPEPVSARELIPNSRGRRSEGRISLSEGPAFDDGRKKTNIGNTVKSDEKNKKKKAVSAIRDGGADCCDLRGSASRRGCLPENGERCRGQSGKLRSRDLDRRGMCILRLSLPSRRVGRRKMHGLRSALQP